MNSVKIEHTPGPLTITPNIDSSDWLISGANGPIATLRLLSRTEGGDYLEVAQSLKRLIAAAPELLAACENARIALTFYRLWMQEHGDAERTEYPFGTNAEREAREAIAKARGESVGQA